MLWPARKLSLGSCPRRSHRESVRSLLVRLFNRTVPFALSACRGDSPAGIAAAGAALTTAGRVAHCALGPAVLLPFCREARGRSSRARESVSHHLTPRP